MAASTKICFLLCIILALTSIAFSVEVTHDGRAIKIDGERKIFFSGSIHYPRSTSEMWPDLIKKAKEGGLNLIETYVFWNAHEPVRRQYDFSGNLDLIKFIKTVQKAGLQAILRIGPYACAEWNYGGFPVWLHNMPGIEIRTDNTVYKNEMQNFTTLIVDMCKKEKLFASQGGPIILAQIENEFGNVMQPYGDAGLSYVNWCADMAVSQNIGVPWIMCQQSNAPEPIINSCNGWYCDQFIPNNPKSPKMWTENWTGWFKNWGGLDPKRTAEDLAFAVARFFQTGGSLQNYYMYHGGTNFGRSAGGPYITTSYDYDAPLDEYGNLNQPKYGHLKQLHEALKSIEKPLTYGDVNTTDLGNFVFVTVYTLNGTSSCMFGNANETSDATVTFGGKHYNVPAWSVSILPDCKKEVYNTAKVNVQTTELIKKSTDENPTPLNWVWIPENIEDSLFRGNGDVSASRLIDQKAANDQSDYLWYMTRLYLDENDPIWTNNMTIRVNVTGQVLHVFVNGELVGSTWKTYNVLNNVFEKEVRLASGGNQISLLSATVGLANYGPFFDRIPAGIPGPVEIVGRMGDEVITKDLSNHVWTYKAGLNGLDEHKFFTVNSANASSLWRSTEIPLNKMMTWYKTTFKTPSGSDPVVVDLLGLGKGMAWVNGNSLGRYWPSYLAAADGCPDGPCDYRGAYSNQKCTSNCGQPTQRWYHVPRSFFNDEDNELILFEELGGNPFAVNFRTVVPKKAYVNAYENNKIELSCQGRPISAILFASFGDVQGTSGKFFKGTCEGKKDALSIVEKACVGKESCKITASEKVFGSTNCSGVPKKLVIEAIC